MKTLFKSLLVLMLLSNSVFAQKNPDTLVIGTKNGQIILVSDSLLKFAPMETQELIRKALYKVMDSLPKSKDLSAKPKAESSSYTRTIKKRAFRVTEDFGLAMIRDKISPVIAFGIEFAPQKQDFFRKKDGMYSFLNLMMNTSFSFREVDNEYETQQNSFLEFTIGNRMNPDGGYRSITELSAGVGYLIQKDGNYFGKNTVKLFFNVGLPNSFIKIRPELYFVNKKVFPGITIKLLNIANYY